MSDKISNAGMDAKRSVIYLIQMLITAAVPLALLPLITRFITPELFGMYAIAQAISTIFVGITGIGLVETMERNYYDHKHDKKELASLIIGNILVMTILFIGIGILLSTIVKWSSGAIVDQVIDPFLFFVVFIGVFITSINTMLMFVARNEGKAIRIATISITTSLLNASIVVYGLLYTELGVYSLGYGILIANLVALILYFGLFAKECGWHINYLITFRAIGRGIWLLPRTLAGGLNTQLDKIIINIIGNTAAVGIYAIGQRLAYGIFLVMNALQHVFAPRLYTFMLDKNKEDNGQRVGHYLTVYFYLVAAIGTLAVTLSGVLIAIIAPEIYSGSELVFIVLTLMYVNMFFGKVAGPQMLLNYKTKIITIQAYIYLLLNIIIMIPSTYYWGIYGAAIGAMMAGTINTIISIWLGQKQYHIKWPIKKLVYIYIVFIFFLATRLLMTVTEVNYITEVLHIATALMTIIIIGKFIGILNVENIKILLNKSK